MWSESSSVYPRTPPPWQSCCPGPAPCPPPRHHAAGTSGCLLVWRNTAGPRLWLPVLSYCRRVQREHSWREGSRMRIFTLNFHLQILFLFSQKNVLLRGGQMGKRLFLSWSTVLIQFCLLLFNVLWYHMYYKMQKASLKNKTNKNKCTGVHCTHLSDFIVTPMKQINNRPTQNELENSTSVHYTINGSFRWWQKTWYHIESSNSTCFCNLLQRSYSRYECPS